MVFSVGEGEDKPVEGIGEGAAVQEVSSKTNKNVSGLRITQHRPEILLKVEKLITKVLQQQRAGIENLLAPLLGKNLDRSIRPKPVRPG